jgi:polysaccharide biosynthesis transport protein
MTMSAMDAPLPRTASVLWRNRLVLVLAVLLAGGGGFLIARGLPKTYTAQGLLVVETGAIAISELGAGLQGGAGSEAIRTQTEAQVLKARALAEAVVRDLGLATDPAFLPPPPWPWLAEARRFLTDLLPEVAAGVVRPPDPQAAAADRLQSRLTVASTDRSAAIVVSYRAEDPELAARIVNRVMARHIDEQVRSRGGMTAHINELLSARSERLWQDVVEADRKVQEFRAAHGLTERPGSDLNSMSLADLDTRLSAARGEVSSLEAAVAGARRALASGGAEASSEVLASPLIQRLREQEATVAGELANQSQRLGPRHPQIRALSEQLGGLRRQIGMEIQKIVQSLSGQFDVAKARVADLEARMATARGQAGTAATADVELQRLVKEADAKRAIHQSYLARVEQTTPSGGPLPDIRIASSAVPPIEPSGPNTLLFTLFAGIAGLGLAGSGAVIRDLVSGRVYSAPEFAHATGLPTFGSVPRVGGGRLGDHVVSFPQGAAAESVRGLWAGLTAARGGRPPRVVLATSAMPGEGKTSLVTALGRIAAADGVRVLVIDADFRRPSIHAVLKGRPEKGAGEGFLDALLAAGELPERALRVDSATGLRYLAAGGGIKNPQAVLSGERMATLIRDATAVFDLVLIDSPPVLRVSDPILLARRADTVLLVGAWGWTHRSMAAAAARRLQVPAGVLAAAVLSRVASRRDGYDDYAGYRRDGARALPAPVASA